jgi:dihydrofolate synthase/folylpolyglutamate synthase
MAADLEDLAKVLREYAPEVKVEMREESTEALDLARQLASPKDLICATGSLYLAAEALRWAASHGAQNAADEIEGVDH